MNLKVKLRKLKKEDLKILFDFQTDQVSNYMAAFVSKDPNNWKEFKNKWENISNHHDNIIRIILYNDEISGYISKYKLLEKPNIGYWIGRKYWGKGIATQAVKEFLKLYKNRPLQARVAFDNLASIKILEKCRFSKIGEDKYFANARKRVITEYIYELSK